MSDAFAHSISPARSRTSSVLGRIDARFAACATTPNLLSSSSQPVSPTTRGQKYCNWRPAPPHGTSSPERIPCRHRRHPARRATATCCASSPAARGRERHRKHLAGRHVTGGHQIRDPPGDRPGLPGAGAREHAHGASRGLNGVALLVVVEVADERASSGEPATGASDGHGVHLGRTRRQSLIRRPPTSRSSSSPGPPSDGAIHGGSVTLNPL